MASLEVYENGEWVEKYHEPRIGHCVDYAREHHSDSNWRIVRIDNVIAAYSKNAYAAPTADTEDSHPATPATSEPEADSASAVVSEPKEYYRVDSKRDETYAWVTLINNLSLDDAKEQVSTPKRYQWRIVRMSDNETIAQSEPYTPATEPALREGGVLAFENPAHFQAYMGIGVDEGAALDWREVVVFTEAESEPVFKWTHVTNPYPTYEPSSGDGTSGMGWSWLFAGTGRKANGHSRPSRNRPKQGQFKAQGSRKLSSTMMQSRTRTYTGKMRKKAYRERMGKPVIQMPKRKETLEIAA